MWSLIPDVEALLRRVTAPELPKIGNRCLRLDIVLITPEQCRAARGLLNWSRSDLAAHSKVAERTIGDFENGYRFARAVTAEALQRAFETAGVGFAEDDERGIGVFISPAAREPMVTHQS